MVVTERDRLNRCDTFCRRVSDEENLSDHVAFLEPCVCGTLTKVRVSQAKNRTNSHDGVRLLTSSLSGCAETGC